MNIISAAFVLLFDILENIILHFDKKHKELPETCDSIKFIFVVRTIFLHSYNIYGYIVNLSCLAFLY